MNPIQTDKINKMMKAATSQGIFPGAVLLVSKNGEIIHHEAYGMASMVPLPRMLDVDTIFDVASLTKPIATATAVFQVIEDGKLSLNTPVSKICPMFSKNGKDKITMKHLLTHSSGLPDWWGLYKELLAQEQKRDKKLIGTDIGRTILRMMLCNIPLNSEPGETIVYSDLGYMVLDWVIERIWGITLDWYCREKIFNLIGMDRTLFSNKIRMSTLQSELSEYDYAATEECPWRKKVLSGEVHDDNCYALGGVAGHAGLFTTAKDIFIFLQQLLYLSIQHLHGMCG